MDPGTIALLVVLALLAVGIGLAVRRAQRAEIAAPPRREELPAPPAPKAKKEDRAAPRAPQAPQAHEEDQEPEEVLEAEEAENKPAPKKVHKKDGALVTGLAKTRGGFVSRLADLVRGKKTVDDATLAKLEEVLLTADIGVKTSQKLFETVKASLSREALADPDALWSEFRRKSREILDT